MIIACPRCQLRYDASGKEPGSSLQCRCGEKLTVPDAAASARSLQCPNCGGPVSANSNQCKFCETDLAVLNCPSCFTLQFIGTKFCSDCGTELSKPARAENQNAFDCPRCETAMATKQYQNGAVEHCEQCGGLWLDHQIFETTIDKTQRKVQNSLQPPKSSQHNVYNNHPVNYMPCPECKSLMNRRNFGQRSGVIVDVCASHGVWLDHKELSAILNFIRGGGLKYKPGGTGAAPLDASSIRTKASGNPFGVSTTVNDKSAASETLGWGDIWDLIESLPLFR